MARKPSRRSRPARFIEELRRRKVFRAAVAYLVVGLAVIEAADILIPRMGLDDWVASLVMLLVALGFPLVLVLAWVYEWTSEGVVRDPTDVPSEPPDAEPADLPEREILPNSLAVLPFANLTPDADNDYFSEGVTEEIIAALCRIPALRVISRTSVARLQRGSGGIREIGRRLGVALVVEGSVRRQNGRVRILAQAVDVHTESSVWSDVYDRDMEDIFAIQSGVAGRIAEAMTARLSPEMERQHRGQRTADPEAYDLYLKALYLWARRTEDSFRSSLDHLERALERDPRFALAHAAVAMTRCTMGVYGALEPDAAMGAAVAAADRALAIDPTTAEALVARGCARAMYRWEWDEGESDFRQAIAAKPSYATAHQWLAVNLLAPQRRFDEAEREMAKAAELDPVSAAVGVSLGVLAYFRGDWTGALERYDEVERIHPEFAAVHFFRGQALVAAGETARAVASFETAIERTGGTAEMRAALAHAEASAGRAGEARDRLERLKDHDVWVSPVLCAQVHVALGETAAALDHLEDAAARRAPDLVWVAVRPTFHPLRGEPRFVDLSRRLGLPSP